MDTLTPDLATDALPPSPAPARTALTFIFITVTLDMLTFGITGPVLPKLVTGFVNGNTARASEVFGIFATVWSLMQFVCSPLLGALSDRIGRRPVIVLSNLGLGLDYAVMALAPNLAWLFLGRVISGITSSTVNTASAYIADVMPPEKRAGAFGMIGAAFGVGFVIGPAIGGLLGAGDPRLPFWVAAGVGLLNGTFGLLVLRESLPPERRSPFSWRRANPLGSLRLLRSHRELFSLAGVSLLSNLAGAAVPSIWVLYVTYRYGWDVRAVGLSLTVIGIVYVAAGPLTRPAVARLGERGAVLTGLAFGALALGMFALAPTGWLFLTAIPVMAVWQLTPAATQAIMTRRVSAFEQGQLQGAIGSIRGISTLFGPAIFTFSFAAAIGGTHVARVPGTPFLLAMLLVLAALAVAWYATRPAEALSSAQGEPM